MRKIVAYARLLRIPGIGGLAIPPVIGAISVGIFDFYNLTIVFIIGALAALYGFILNDYADVEVDRLSKDLHGKPLVSGDISIKTALIICIFFILFSFLLVGILWYGQTVDRLKFSALLSLFIAGVLGSIYDFFGKKIVGSDFLVAISVAFVFLFGALSFAQPTIVTWIIFILTFNQILHMNAVEGGIKDADHDPKMGVKNIALSMGVKMEGLIITIPRSFKIFSIGIRLFSAVLLFLPFIVFNYDYYVWQLIILGLAITGVFFYSFKLLSIKIFNRNKIRKIIAIQSFLRYSLVPIMLISIVPSILYSIILIIFPIIWYILFTPMIKEKLFRPRM
ncbi:MAG: UbiA family prenyltransferase [Candidatus Thermoplasmatota archaeon]|jgi:4-hydroxybenzoate polyprenyltransferase|nr:UbiA family prenyltransferase [Candidatus Thermoplasmatota archaeon]